MSILTETDKMDYAKFSISCFNIPDELLDKTVAKHHFQQFGRVLRIRLRPKHKYCSVEFSNEEDAKRALVESDNFNGIRFKTTWTRPKNMDKKKERKKEERDPDWTADPEVQAELNALKELGGFSSKSYNLRPEAMSVDQTPAPKKPLTLKKSREKSRLWKSDKVSKTKQPEFTISSSSYTSEQEAELLKIIMQAAQNSEEKFRILDARDKLIRLRTVRQSDLAKASRTIGTCPDMCPEKERLMRETRHQIAIYEQAGGYKNNMNHAAAVKQYSRSSADQEAPLAHELRPVGVLQMTMSYLLHRIMDLSETPDVNLAEWYHFLWDRMRGIRKDITQQELCCQGSVELVEQCARFHIHCSARLVAEDVSVFDQKINTENLTKCLQTLKYMYHDLALKNETCPNEAEFRGYIVLLNLHDGNFMWEVQQLSREIQRSPEVKFAIQVYSALDKNNYVKFFKLVKSTSYLNACILLRYFNQVRYRSMLRILKSYSPRQPYTQFPVLELKNLLAFEDLENTVAFLECYGLSLNRDRSHVILDRKMFCQPDLPFFLERAINVIESKRVCSIGEIVCGSNLPPKTFENHVPHESFDEKGYLKLSEIPKEWEAKYQEYLTEFTFGLTTKTEEEKEEPKQTFTFSTPPLAETTPTIQVPQSTTSFTFQTPTNMFSKEVTETDNVKAPAFTFKSALERSQSPLLLTSEQQSNKEPIKPFWSTHSTSFNSFDSNKSIFSGEPPSNQISFPTMDDESPKEMPSQDTFKFPAQNIPSSHVFQPINTTNKTIPSEIFSFARPVKPVAPTIQPQKQETVFNIPTFTPSIYDFIMSESKKCPEIEFSIANPDNPVNQTQTKSLEDKLKEERAKEETAKREEERRKEEKRWLEEKRKAQILEEKRKKREAEKIAGIKLEVNGILNELLDRVYEQQVQNRLKEIGEKIKTRKILHYVQKWRRLTWLSKKKRKNFFDSPTWISSRSITDEASELFTPSQSLALHDMKRYKLGSSIDIKIKELQTITKLDLFKIVWKSLFEKLCKNEDFLQLHIYWKIAIFLPDENEATKGLQRLEDMLKRAFDWQWHLSNRAYMAVKRFQANNGGTFTYCVKKYNGSVIESVKNLNGLIFIISDNVQLARIRFANIFTKKKTCSLPVIILVTFKCPEKQIISLLNLDELENRGLISNYEIFIDHTRSEKTFECSLIKSLQFLAQNVNEVLPPLEMDALAVCLQNCVGEELCYRLRASSKINKRLEILLCDPNVAINLHNEAVNNLSDMLFDPDLQKFPDFPTEFKHFLNLDLITLPCTYEYFPNYWRSKHHMTKIENIVQSMIFPPYEETWPPSNQFLLQSHLENYCSKVFKDPTNVVLKVLSAILKHIDINSPDEFEEQIRTISWMDVVTILTIEKISKTQFCDFNVNPPTIHTVVYKIEDMKTYRRVPWWYSTEEIKNKIKFVQIQEFDEPEIEIMDDDSEEFNLDETILEMQKNAEKEIKEENNELKEELKELKLLADDLEKSMDIQRKILSKFEETARRALACD